MNLDFARKTKQGGGVAITVTRHMNGREKTEALEHRLPLQMQLFAIVGKAVVFLLHHGKTSILRSSGRVAGIDESPPTNRMMKWPFKYKSLEPQTW